MSNLEQRVKQKVKEWVSSADDDLAYAELGLDHSAESMNPQIAFHAQQCAEKYLKAYLVYRMVKFPYTHDISVLLRLCGETAGWVAEINGAKKLTDYATTLRYPGEENVVTRQEAIEAVGIAIHTSEVVRKALVIDGLI